MSYSFMRILGPSSACTIKQLCNILIKKLKLQKSCISAKTRAPAPFKEGAKKDRSCTRQPSRLSLKTKNTPQNSQKYLECQKCKKKKTLIKWSIVKRVPPYQCGSRTFQLCLAEKMIILQANKKNLLNERSELMSKCCHINKLLLKKCSIINVIFVANCL